MIGKELYTAVEGSGIEWIWHTDDSVCKAQLILQLLARNHYQPHRLIDVGCGAGGVLSTILDKFPEAEGIGFDISPHAIAIAQKTARRNLQFECTDFLDHPDYSGYDLLLCIDVFEHVEDYIGFLKKIRARSEYFVFHVPLDMNIKGLLRKHHMKQRRQVGHIHYFDYMTTLAVLNEIGYKIVDRCYTFDTEGMVTKVITGCRKMLAVMAGEDLAVQVLGGASMLILARAK